MTNTWYIQIFSSGTNKKGKEMFDIMEQRTLRNKQIGIDFDSMPIFDKDNNFINIRCEDTNLTKRQELYRKNVFKHFINTMKIGDIVYLKNGKNILYKAIIDSDYIYDDSNYIRHSTSKIYTQTTDEELSWFWRHRRNIKNIEKISEINKGYSRMTLYKKIK